MLVRYLFGITILQRRRCRQEKLQNGDLHGFVGIGRLQHAHQDGHEWQRNTTSGSFVNAGSFVNGTVLFYLVLQQTDQLVEFDEGITGRNLIKQCFEGCWLVPPQYLFFDTSVVILTFLAPILLLVLSFLDSFAQRGSSSTRIQRSGTSSVGVGVGGSVIRIGRGRKVPGLDGRSRSVSTERARMNWQQVRATRPEDSAIVAITRLLMSVLLISGSSSSTFCAACLREETTRRPLLSTGGRSRSLASYSDSEHSFLHRGDPYQTPEHR
jgi:hypothetical protein